MTKRIDIHIHRGAAKDAAGISYYKNELKEIQRKMASAGPKAKALLAKAETKMKRAIEIGVEAGYFNHGTVQTLAQQANSFVIEASHTKDSASKTKDDNGFNLSPNRLKIKQLETKIAVLESNLSGMGHGTTSSVKVDAQAKIKEAKAELAKLRGVEDAAPKIDAFEESAGLFTNASPRSKIAAMIEQVKAEQRKSPASEQARYIRLQMKLKELLKFAQGPSHDAAPCKCHGAK